MRGIRINALNAPSYCAILVRAHDPDRYRLGLSQAAGRRDAVWPLFAFNYEIAKTAEVVSEPTLGLIRLQWWRDALDNIYAGGVVPAHEILQALAAVIAAHKLPQDLFTALLDAREFDLAGRPAADLDALALYAEQTTAPLNRLALMVLGQQAAETVAAISTAYALTGLLRAAPFRTARNLPLLLPHGVSGAEIAARAESALMATPSPRGFLKASAVLTRHYLRQLRRCDYDARVSTWQNVSAGFNIAALFGRFH